ncbi:MAG: DNA replication licensing factor Mcm3 [Amphiamblys sp. WSBS2006]|nr:MAG: DNA replication licensing factor Mcm3 [Amphiamblys sp. WSBS2006]
MQNTINPPSDYENQFRDFLDSHAAWSSGKNYRNAIVDMVENSKPRLMVDLSDLRSCSPELARTLLTKPLSCLHAFETALNDLAANITTLSAPQKAPFKLSFKGSFGGLHKTPRTLSSECLSHMVCVEGIAVSCSLVRPKLERSVHFCESTKKFYAKKYTDNMTLGTSTLPTLGSSYPTDDGKGNRLTTEFGLSDYTDHQTVTLQEIPEKAPPGQLPRSIDVVLEQDLTDSIKPGSRVRVCGVYKPFSPSGFKAVGSFFKTAVLANTVEELGAQCEEKMDEKDVQEIQKLAQEKNILSYLSGALANSICGHDHIKRAIILMLLGGVEKNLANGTHIRGDINIMLVGDPSTAKSQLLRFVLKTAPLAIATTGRGSTGVGLTAAVISDKETGERKLEAGAMVLADRGVICIDEFDKMNDMDRVAIHEVMEQQTVTIAKAGIHASLNARCSVLAAANPVWGQYRETKTPQENINLPDSLLSRFDLVFIVLDTIDPETDRLLSEHVLRSHQYIPPGLAPGEPIDFSLDMEIKKHAQEDEHALSMELIKKYIRYARENTAPILSREAIAEIARCYGEFRQQPLASDEKRTFPVTPRTLETLIRLSVAHAKLRLSDLVEIGDVVIAHGLIEFCLYKTVKKKQPVKRARTEDLGEAPAAEDTQPAAGDVLEKTGTEAFAPLSFEGLHKESSQSQASTNTQEKRALLCEALNKIRENTGGSHEVDVEDLHRELSSTLSSHSQPSSLTPQDIEEILLDLQSENRIMYANGKIYFI